jgi:hypothetical protein
MRIQEVQTNEMRGALKASTTGFPKTAIELEMR